MNQLYPLPVADRFDMDTAQRCQRALNIAAADRRAINRREVRLLVSDARAALRRLNDYGIYSSECWAFEEEAKDTKAAAIEAFCLRNEA